MITFGNKIAMLRKEKGWSQTELSKKLNTSVSVISRYERDDMIPSIEAAKKLAELLSTTVGYLLGESEDSNLFKDPDVLYRFNEIKNFAEKEKEHIFFAIDAMIHEIKNRRTYAVK
jgi:transcriptional regulator with XRE-family HTH domain